MKKLIITTLSILTISIAAIATYTNKEEATPTTIQQQYTITQIVNHDTQDTEYYGQSVDSDNGIYFTEDYINFIGSIEEGDTITAHFENELDDSLLYVTK